MGDDGIVLRPSGDLDLVTAPTLRASVEEALAEAPPVLVFDLSDVDFLDSSGIAVLAMALRRQRVHGGSVAVTHPKPIVRRAVDLVGLGMLFDLTQVPADLLA